MEQQLPSGRDGSFLLSSISEHGIAGRATARSNKAQRVGKARRKRGIGTGVDPRSPGLENGGLVKAVLLRQATGGRARSGGWATGGKVLGPRELVFSTHGKFRKRIRRQLEGVPEMIADLSKALAPGDQPALFSAVHAVKNKLVEGTSAPFDLPTRPSSSGAGGSSGGGGGGGGSGADGHHHRHGEDDYDDPYSQNGYRQVRRLDREVFVTLGGADLLVEVLKRAGSPADARSISPAVVARDTPVWNMTLIVLRELCFMDQDLSERLGSNELILYLLTMMAHPGIFDIAVGLVEEILAVKSSTYFLGKVPELHSLVENMSSQQLAHFSRVLALLVFEPEYRQIMESPHVLRSMELLQLRRDRVVRADSVIDKNQALILSAPNLLPRLMELLRIMNFNPPLALFDEQALELQDAHVAQVRISFVGGGAGGVSLGSLQQPPASDWEYLSGLRAAAEATASGAASGSSGVAQTRPPSNRQDSSNQHTRSSSSSGSSRSAEPSRIGNFFRSLFRRNPLQQQQHEEPVSAVDGLTVAGTGSFILGTGTAAPSRGTEGASEAEGAGEAEGAEGAGEAGGTGGAAATMRQHIEAWTGISDARFGTGTLRQDDVGVNLPPPPPPVAESGGPANVAIRDVFNLLNPGVGGPGPAGSIASLEQALNWPVGGGEGGGGTMINAFGGGGVMNRRRMQHASADEAREELQFNGLMLAPHQVEVLFVLCTLLGARRKGEAHEALANLGIIDILEAMFDRLSWGVPPRQEGPHGAHCDCNPESALRVQYLRLVHNFLDRDSNNNPLKRLLLSPHERRLFAIGRFMPNPNGSGNVVFVKDGTLESEVQLPFVWRGRVWPGAEAGDESKDDDEERSKWVDTRGLLSKIVDVFMKEPMDSLYRFWLASCVEAFLRGGSAQEQLFIAGGGLLPHLVKEITLDGIWCAGSLQTAFDLLGELSKGNQEVLEMLEACMTEKQMRRFLEVMVDNLVDSNVFMRSLVLSVEHSTFRQDFGDEWAPRLAAEAGRAASSSEDSSDSTSSDVKEKSDNGDDYDDDNNDGDGGSGDYENEEEGPCYLGHTWYDVQPREVVVDGEDRFGESGDKSWASATAFKSASRSDLAVGFPLPRANNRRTAARSDASSISYPGDEGDNAVDSEHSTDPGVEESKGCGVFEPEEGTVGRVYTTALTPGEGVVEPSKRGSLAWGGRAGVGLQKGGLTRLQCFLKRNTPQLVRDLMCVVDLETINHENICCLNTAVLILIFADQRGQLAELLEDVRKLPAGKGVSGDAGFLSELDDIDGEKDSRPSIASRSSTFQSSSSSNKQRRSSGDAASDQDSPPQDGPTVLRGFRRLLWFWGEYYLRGGRDRLSLEFSTHVKFWAWKRVIRLLCADDGSPTALVDAPLKLPRSPYETAVPSSNEHNN